MQVYFLITSSSSDFRLKFIIRCLLSLEGTQDVMGHLADKSTAITMKTPTPPLDVPLMWWGDLAYSALPATIGQTLLSEAAGGAVDVSACGSCSPASECWLGRS